jgi:RNA polymerase-binding protein DksA
VESLTAFSRCGREMANMIDPQTDSLNKVHQFVPETEKILGRIPETPADAVPPADVPTLDPASIRPQWRPYYERLLQLRDQLLDREKTYENLAEDNQPEFVMQIADAATESYMRDFELGIASHDTEMISEIQEALQRIADGTYGICQSTGKPIPPERLEAVPWTRFSVQAEEKLEKDHEEPIHAEVHPRGSLAPTEERAAREEADNTLGP